MSRLTNGERAGAAAVVALSGAILALVANGPGRLSLRRIVAGALSNPVPRQGDSAVQADRFRRGGGRAPERAPGRAAGRAAA